MKSKKPLISVIVPVFNAAGFIRESVTSILGQNYHPLELIIVDDGSTDNTEDVVGRLKEELIYIKKDNGGPSSARNRGLQEAKGDFISFLDADDLWLPGKLELQMKRFESDPETEIVLGFTKRFLSPGVEPPPDFDPEKDDKPQLVLHVGAGLYRKSVFDRIGLFDEKMLFSEDIDWFLRAIETNRRISVLKKTVQLYRIHQANLTGDKEKNQHYLLRAFKASLDRRRKLNPEKPPALPDIFHSKSLVDYFQNNKM